MPRLLSMTMMGLIAGFVAGCGDKLPTQTDVESIMPLNAGNVWNGRMVYMDGDDTLAITPHKISVTETQQRHDKSVHRVESFPTKQIDCYEWLWNGPLGLQNDPTDRCGGVRALYPAAAGDEHALRSGTTLIDIPGSNPGTGYSFGYVDALRVVATDSVITVPAGTFSCYVYTWKVQYLCDPQSLSLPPVEFYAPNVGPIRFDYRNGTAWELVSYELK